ncbi:hypothetical protein LDC_1662 [sediment metagenome]|uniref:Uncharacterized protein n=1 Tax=sediment metagenome TaxID=749907 RepID=D9PJF3_9ZZZZ
MEKRKSKRPQRNRTAFAVTLILVVGAFCFIWWVWPGLYNVSPQFNSILLEKNGEPLKLIKGETLRLHPQDHIKILTVSTNITFNIGVRLVANDMDIEALTYDKFNWRTLLSPNGGPVPATQHQGLCKRKKTVTWVMWTW